MEVINGLTSESFVISQILGSILVGLVCVQRRPEDRPTLSYVVVTLDSEIPLSQLKQPVYSQKEVFLILRKSLHHARRRPSYHHIKSRTTLALKIIVSGKKKKDEFQI